MPPILVNILIKHPWDERSEMPQKDIFLIFRRNPIDFPIKPRFTIMHVHAPNIFVSTYDYDNPFQTNTEYYQTKTN